MQITQPKRPGPKPRGAVRPQQHQGGPGARPFTWLVGPDPVRHAQYVAWGRSRAQALWRQEGWDLSFDQFLAHWHDQWQRRGRVSDALCMTRRDCAQPWSDRNVELITRAEHNRRCSAARLAAR